LANPATRTKLRKKKPHKKKQLGLICCYDLLLSWRFSYTYIRIEIGSTTSCLLGKPTSAKMMVTRHLVVVCVIAAMMSSWCIGYDQSRKFVRSLTSLMGSDLIGSNEIARLFATTADDNSVLYQLSSVDASVVKRIGSTGLKITSLAWHPYQGCHFIAAHSILLPPLLLHDMVFVGMCNGYWPICSDDMGSSRWRLMANQSVNRRIIIYRIIIRYEYGGSIDILINITIVGSFQ
jgi:hypothetical protein